MSGTDEFFEDRTHQSEVKSAIVAKYFDAWANVIVNAQKRRRERSVGTLAYVDLFAGPGTYGDGIISTPLLVLRKAVQDTELRQRLVTVFNDQDPQSCETLRSAIAKLPDVDKLSYEPKVTNLEVGEQVVSLLEQMHTVPTLFFFDPWGYKGLSLRLIESAAKDWGCDCIFFFNYNRINMNLGLDNEAVQANLAAIFGPERAARLRQALRPMPPPEREVTILEELCKAVADVGPDYVLPFCFRNAQGTRTSHYLIFVSKHFLGYEIMKEIMARQSSTKEQGVPSFAYCPAEARQTLLFELSRPLDDLEEMLLSEFAGQTLTMKDVYMRHNVGCRYIKKNYKDILRALDDRGKISAGVHRRGYFPDRTVVTFPRRER